MEIVSGKLNDGVLTVFLCGKVNSVNAAEVEANISELRAQYPSDNIIIDAENLEYISSAGLRIILRLSRDYPDMKLINASSSVYEIFEMTGFTEMITVEKAYRRLSIDGCEVIGEGANGKVYRLDADTIIKVYRNPDSLPDIQRERELARKAFVLGIPTAIPYDVVRVGDSYGSVFELLNATSFAKLLTTHPENALKYIDDFVEVLKKLHSTVVQPGDMPDMKAVAIKWADFLKDYIPNDQEVKLMELIAAVPDRHTMIHGDYHIKNIMMQNDEVLLIDMDTLSMGHPVFELASMYLGFVGFGECDPTLVEDFLGIPYDSSVKFWRKSLKLYLGTDDDAVANSVEEKCRIVGYTRLLRRTIRRNGDTDEGRRIIEMCKKNLAELLPKTDTLDF